MIVGVMFFHNILAEGVSVLSGFLLVNPLKDCCKVV